MKQMYERLTQKYRVMCDRCGKEWHADEKQKSGLFDISFKEEKIELVYGDTKARGGVCQECYNDFCEIAENFFDEANRRATDDKKKPDAIYLGFSQHDCEAHYKCPLCGKGFGSWSIDMKNVRCPNCKEELGGIR